jgi:hypothetical protein
MLLQNPLIQRITVVLIFQIWPIFFLSYLAYRMLKRARNRTTLTIGSVFIFNAFAYFLIFLSIVSIYTPFALHFYIGGMYFFVFGNSFFIISTWVLVNLENQSYNWSVHILITCYGILSSYLPFVSYFFQGIKYDSSTGWIPTYSWFLLALSWVLFTIFMVIPQIYLSVKLVKVFEGVVLKKRIVLFLISVFCEFSLVFALFLYNAWVDNQIYRTFYLLVFPILGYIGAYLIYRGFVRELK